MAAATALNPNTSDLSVLISGETEQEEVELVLGWPREGERRKHTSAPRVSVPKATDTPAAVSRTSLSFELDLILESLNLGFLAVELCAGSLEGLLGHPHV